MLTRLISTDVLHRLQERFAALGRVTVCLCTIEGHPVTRPTWGSPYSEMIGTSPRGRAAFTEAMRACAADIHARVPSICHDGMTLYATPIDYDGEHLGTIIVGTRLPQPPPPEKVRAIAVKYGVDPDLLLSVTDYIDPYSGGTPEAIHQFADTLAETIATLYGQADRIQRQFADLKTVHELSELLSGTVDVQKILDVTVKRAVEALAVKAGVIRLLNEESGEMVIRAVHNLSEAYLQKGPVRLQDNAVDVAAFAGETVYLEDAPTDPRTRYPESARREGLVSVLCVPMTYRGQTVGVLRVYTGERYAFSESEAALLRSIASQAASAIINSRLYEEQLRSEQVQRQVKTAAEIQRRMLPSRPPQHVALEFGCVYDPTLQVGGDFYDFIERANGNLGLCIADVVGKGLPAALLMASVRSALRAQASCAYDVRTAVAAVNQHMFRDTLVGEFATMFYGEFSSEGHILRYCNAGHPPPVLLRKEQFIRLDIGGPVIGIAGDTDFEEALLRLHSEDILVLSTDGVIEAMNFQGEEFGQQRLLASIMTYRHLDAVQLARQILWDVRRFAGLAEQSDDITIVVARVK